MSRRKISAELSAENPVGGGYFYAELELPATAQQIKDAKQRARFVDGSDTQYQSISILSAPQLNELMDIQIDTMTIEELNFLAKRLSELPDYEYTAYRALLQNRYFEETPSELVSIRDLINMTYGLDSLIITSGIWNDEQLGQFVIENELLDEVAVIPDSVLHLLDKRKIGKLQRENDGGVLIDGFYVVTGTYELPEVYDGEHLPEADDETDVFRIKISDPYFEEPEDGDNRAVWISLPTDYEKASRFAKETFHVPSIEDCVYFDFESAIPSITDEVFEVMTDFKALNAVAERYLAMTDAEQIRYKAILDSECIETVGEALKAADRVNEYELSYFTDDENAFFKEYLSHHLNVQLDRRWLDHIQASTEGNHLLIRLGAKVTPYGILSARGGSLFHAIPFDEPEAKKLTAQAMTDEKLEVVEVLGQTALFTNGRVTQKELPDGLYKYDLREGESISFATIEPSVVVNHGGTVITKEPIKFGEEGYIAFDDDSSPNFLGEHMTVEEFMNADFTQNEDDSQTMGGIQL